MPEHGGSLDVVVVVDASGRATMIDEVVVEEGGLLRESVL